jgi:hypothetical protein
VTTLKKTAGTSVSSYIKLALVMVTLTASQLAWSAYNRDAWGFNPTQSHVKDSLVGWYSGITGNPTDIDHLVAFKDAYLSGGRDWTEQKKHAFANDPLNQVPAHPYINRVVKNKYPPFKFIARMRSSNFEFDSGKCIAYLKRYVGIKSTYGLSVNSTWIQSAYLLCMTPYPSR